MSVDQAHPSDAELLALADGELTAARAAEVRGHLEACWPCRARRQRTEEAIAEFVSTYRDRMDGRLPAAEGPRALLKARMAEAGTGAEPARQWPLAVLAAALAGALLLSPTLLTRLARTGRESSVVFSVPEHRLTPGATVRMSREEVCAAQRGKNQVVPVDLQRRVLEAYGIREGRTQDYEIDYLITPALGGADDIRNLWPQAYGHTVWNAGVKDELEDRLHELVCAGDVDLRTAQNEIATDWIAAYKKYFHTDWPRR
jgi:hypothetical protein